LLISSFIFSPNTSAGVCHPKHLRRGLSSGSQICLMSRSVIDLMSRLQGSQRVARRFRTLVEDVNARAAALRKAVVHAAFHQDR
jgi:hypothetical protein